MLFYKMGNRLPTLYFDPLAFGPKVNGSTLTIALLLKRVNSQRQQLPGVAVGIFFFALLTSGVE
jgi:hypothetical protein